MSVTLIRANANALPLADQSVDLIVTSPPYYGLRSYTDDDGKHYAGQIGSEATPGEFLDALIAATAEMVRVLKPSGSIWVNLGDKYSSGGRSVYASDTSARRQPPRVRAQDDSRPKSLLGIPWRYALRCLGHGTVLADPDVVRLLLRDVALGVLSLAEAERIVDELAGVPDPGLGLILRAEVIWSKPNGLPESVTDRVRRSHEQWFHLVKSRRYYSAVDEIREGHSPNSHPRRKDGQPSPKDAAGLAAGVRRGYMPETSVNPLGKLPCSVWSIPTQPLTVPDHLGVDHFAAFPMEWPRRIITGWSPSGICTACGEASHGAADRSRRYREHVKAGTNGTRITSEICACPHPSAPTRPAVVLDPFGGTSTTAMVAHALGRHGVSVDMSADYCRLARWRSTDPAERAKAAQVEKPPPVPEDMAALW